MATSPPDLRPDPLEVGLHVLLPFGQPPRDDPRLLVRLRRDCRRQSGRSRSHPAPLPNQSAVAGRFHLEPPGRADAVGTDDVPHPAALILDLDDLAHRLPVAERIVAAAAAEAGADLDAVGAVEPFDGLQLLRASSGQSDVGDVIPQRGDIAADPLGHFYRGLIAVAHRASLPRMREDTPGSTRK